MSKRAGPSQCVVPEFETIFICGCFRTCTAPAVSVLSVLCRAAPHRRAVRWLRACPCVSVCIWKCNPLLCFRKTRWPHTVGAVAPRSPRRALRLRRLLPGSRRVLLSPSLSRGLSSPGGCPGLRGPGGERVLGTLSEALLGESLAGSPVQIGARGR